MRLQTRVLAAHTRVPVAKVIPGDNPSAVSRHEITATPVLLATVLAARQSAALPVANGPSAVAHAGAFNASVTPDWSSRLAQACGTRVIHCPRRLLVRHACILVPLVKRPRTALRHRSTGPMAYGPRSSVQSRTMGTNARPLVVARSAQAPGRADPV